MDNSRIGQIIFLSVILFLAGILGNPTFSLEQPLWHRSNLQVPLQYTNKREAHIPIQLRLNQVTSGLEKRGFSILARWKPFNVMGKHRTSIRDVNRAFYPYSEYDIVSAETRAFSRPPGQPLRWG